MAKRAKPFDPAAAARAAMERRRQALEAVNLSPEIAELLSGANIEVTRAGDKREGQTVKDDSARRLDAFDALKDGMREAKYAGAYDAARRLEADMLTRRGEGDKGQRIERVDCDGGRDVTDLIVAAGQACDYIKARLSRRDWWLLNELIQPTIDRGDWRAHVFYVTGEANPHSQGAAVRSACVNLRDAYEDLEQAQAGQRRAA